MPRATTFTDHAAGVIVRAVRAGLTDRAACGVAGVPVRTFRRWLAEGRRLDEADADPAHPLADFARRVEDARAVAAEHSLRSAARTDWRAAVKVLDLEDLRGRLDRMAERVARLSAGRG